jgi:preprotein translocase subunit SecG
MKTLLNILPNILMFVSILLIVIVLLQSGKAESASNIIMGGNAELFNNRKERGAELFISRFTMTLGILFFLISLILSF